MTKKQKAAKKRRNRKILIVVIELLVLAILAAVLYVVVQLSKIEKEVTFTPEDIKVNDEISSESLEIMEGYTSIALFGLDNRSNGNLSKGNSDVIMIASINNDTHEVKLVSIYRDSYLDIGDNTYRKCNSAYAKGGPEQAINMLNTNLDLNITDYVTVDFNAVVECVDLLGGVEITITDLEAVLMYGYMDEINKLTKNNSEYLPGAGTYNMDGVQACAYARIRQTTGSDYKRTERQRTIIAAMVEKAQKADLKTINKLIDTVFGDIKTSFSNTDLIALAAKVFDYKLGETAGFPFVKNTIKLGSKGDCVIPCDLESNVIELHKFLYNEEDYVPTEKVKKNSQQIIEDTGYHQEDGY
ncbi:MAG: LCP family protein [Roseburia sp.]|nr:LCP family protein [Roseburia sp.]